MNPAPEIFKGHLLKGDHDVTPTPTPKCTHLILNVFPSWLKASFLILVGRPTQHGGDKKNGDKWIVFLTNGKHSILRAKQRSCRWVRKATVEVPNSPWVFISFWGAPQMATMCNKEAPNWNLTIPPPQLRLGAMEGSGSAWTPYVFSPNQTVHFQNISLNP